MTSGFELGDSCSSEDARNKIGDVEGLSESTGICTEVESEAQKKFFGLIWLPVYKWGVSPSCTTSSSSLPGWLASGTRSSMVETSAGVAQSIW